MNDRRTLLTVVANAVKPGFPGKAYRTVTMTRNDIANPSAWTATVSRKRSESILHTSSWCAMNDWGS